VASHEATNTLHQAMCLATYLPGGMVVAIAVDSITFYYTAIENLIKLQGYFGKRHHHGGNVCGLLCLWLTVLSVLFLL